MTSALVAICTMLGVLSTRQFTPPVLNIEHVCATPPPSNQILAWCESLGWQMPLLCLLTFLSLMGWRYKKTMEYWAKLIYLSGSKLELSDLSNPLILSLMSIILMGAMSGLIMNWMWPPFPVQWVCTCPVGATPKVSFQGKSGLVLFLLITQETSVWVKTHYFLATWALAVMINLCFLLPSLWDSLRMAAGHPRQVPDEDSDLEDMNIEDPPSVDSFKDLAQKLKAEMKRLWENRPWRKS